MPVSMSDHDLVYAILKLKRQRPKPTFITTKSFKKKMHLWEQSKCLADQTRTLRTKLDSLWK